MVGGQRKNPKCKPDELAGGWRTTKKLAIKKKVHLHCGVLSFFLRKFQYIL